MVSIGFSQATARFALDALDNHASLIELQNTTIIKLKESFDSTSTAVYVVATVVTGEKNEVSQTSDVPEDEAEYEGGRKRTKHRLHKKRVFFSHKRHRK